MEEYDAVETGGEMESPGNDAEAVESFMDTVSGNDAGADTATDGQGEALPESSVPEGQDELLESLNALVEALTPSGEEAETEEGTGAETETQPSETETAVLELLEKIYAETAESRTADSLYYETWAEYQAAVQERTDTQFSYTFSTQIVLVFLCAVVAGLFTAKIIWERFK